MRTNQLKDFRVVDQSGILACHIRAITKAAATALAKVQMPELFVNPKTGNEYPSQPLVQGPNDEPSLRSLGLRGSKKVRRHL